MICNNKALMSLPSPCGLVLGSVACDGRYLYLYQPDKKTVYKTDLCGRILCSYKTCRRYSQIICRSPGFFYAVSDCDKYKIYILNGCFCETGYISPDLSEEGEESPYYFLCPCRRASVIGLYNGCSDEPCEDILAATENELFRVDSAGSVSEKISHIGRNMSYTAVFEANGILYEAFESTSHRSYVRATNLANGSKKTQTLPYGYKIKGFFCFDGRVYAFVTKNGFHAYVAAACVYIGQNGVLAGEVINLGEMGNTDSCCEESCGIGGGCSKCTCGSVSCSSCSGVSSENSNFCDSEVSGDSTDDCDINEICRFFNCIKKLCENGVMGDSTENDGIRPCRCRRSDILPENCLPLAPCPTRTESECEENGNVPSASETENTKSGEECQMKVLSENIDILSGMTFGDILNLIAELKK